VKNNILTLIEETSITGSGPILKVAGGQFTVHATSETTSGSGSVVVVIEGSNLPSPSRSSDWKELGTITLTPTIGGDSDGFPVATSWDKVRARLTTITGTGVKMSAYICEGR
jgi:hypothetical protein